MKESYWGYWLVILGVFVVIIMLLIQNITSNSTEDYYSVKEITEASLVDAVDLGYYRDFGELKINKEKFMESFMRRFAEIAGSTSNYKITFTGIYETPPKASVEITSSTASYVVAADSAEFDITNRVDGILEMENYQGSESEE